MNALAGLLTLALALAFGAGALWLAPAPAPAGRGVAREELDGLLQRFAGEQRPSCALALSRLFAKGDGDALLDPATLLPRTAELPLDELAALDRAIALGRLPVEPAPTDPLLAKAAAWHAARAGRGAWGDERFREPPFTHPAGASYVRLASAEPLWNTAAWVGAHLAYAHAGELAALARDIRGLELDAPRAVLARLGANELAALREREPVVLGAAELLLVHGDADAYDAYPRARWDAWVAGTPYRLVRHAPGTPALARRGRLDWVHDDARTRRTHRIALAGLGVLAAIVVGLLMTRVKMRLEEARRRRFKLQTLTHELRTPLTSMTLALEELRARFDGLPEPAQDAVLRACDDLARLRRVVETSRAYLNDSTSRRLLDLSPGPVPSLRDWLAELVDDPALELLAHDAPVRLDVHWTGVCVTNLVQNALRHGRPPVRVIADVEKDALVLTVEDAGTCAFDDLDAMAAPFVRGPLSAGSGLGLALARSIALEMGGSLTYLSRPTRFVLRLPGVIG